MGRYEGASVLGLRGQTCRWRGGLSGARGLPHITALPPSPAQPRSDFGVPFAVLPSQALLTAYPP